MPVTRTATLAAVLVGLSFDMVNKVATATIRTTVDGQKLGEDQTFTAAGADFDSLLASPGVEGLTLADQVTNGAYSYLISKGNLTGEIS